MGNLQQRLDDLRRHIRELGGVTGTSAEIAQNIIQLEQMARELLTDAKNTPYETAAQELFAELARLTSPTATVNATTAATVRGLVRRARIRLEIAGDDDDIDEAIDILAEALGLNPQDSEVIGLLQESADHNAQARQRVNDLFGRHSITAHTPPPMVTRPSVSTDTAVLTPLPPRYPTSSGYPAPEQELRRSEGEPPGRRLPGQGPLYVGSDIDDLVSEMTQAYYAGDYQLTVDSANRILTQQPGNATALEYRQKAEDNLIRGIVPDHRIPFDARVAYNRANSLVRAGNYDEAERLYREARDLAERNGILSWKDAEQAMLDIQDLALARELIVDGNRLMATDNWSEALRKYEGALRVMPNDPQAVEQIEKVRRIQQDTDQAAVQLSMLGGALTDQVVQLQNVLMLLARVRQSLPNSQRIIQLQKDASARQAGLRTQISDHAQAAATRAHNAVSLEERLTLSNEALRLLELGVELDPSDATMSELMRDTRTSTGDTQRARQVIERAAALIAQNFDNELTQARTMLAGLRDYSQDERYRNVVTDLLARFMERAEIALDEGDVAEAETWLETMREEPFRILGRRTEVNRLEGEIRSRRQQGRLRILAFLGGVVLIVGVALFLTRNSWYPALFPPPTATATPTLTPSITPTPSVTPIPSDTPPPSNTPTATSTRTPSPTATWTNTPTWTWTPSPTITPSYTVTASLTPTETLTPTHTPTVTPTYTPSMTPTETLTPTITPTPPELCRVVVLTGDAKRIRSRPTTNSQIIGFLNPGTPADVLEQRYENDNRSNPVWYNIRVQVEGNFQTGWVRADGVTQMTNCPPPP